MAASEQADGNSSGSPTKSQLPSRPLLNLPSSKKVARQKRKQEKRAARAPQGHLFDLPHELLFQILALLLPSDLFRLSRSCRALSGFISAEEAALTRSIIATRYGTLSKCFRLPRLLTALSPSQQCAVQAPWRLASLHLLTKPYTHIAPPDPASLCTCTTCLQAWNALNLLLDFACWQEDLDAGRPIPTIPRGRCPEWNKQLVRDHASHVLRALRSPLYYALLLQTHLASTVRSIGRQRANKGNKRARFRMSEGDVAGGTDAFLEGKGPPGAEMPFHRDQYYLLEVYCPGRAWSGGRGVWMYMPEEQHEADVGFAVRELERRALKGAREEERSPTELREEWKQFSAAEARSTPGKDADTPKEGNTGRTRESEVLKASHRI